MKVFIGMVFLASISLYADDVSKTQELGKILEPFRTELTFYSDGRGNYLVDVGSRGGLSDSFFFGDGHTFYQLAGLLGGSDHKTRRFDLQDPRYPKRMLGLDPKTGTYPKAAAIFDSGGQKIVNCGGNTAEMKKVTAEESARIGKQVHFVALPDVEKPYFFLKTEKSGELVLFNTETHPLKNPDDTQFSSFYFGQPGSLVKGVIKNAVHKGESTILEMDKGKFALPEQFEEEPSPPVMVSDQGTSKLSWLIPDEFLEGEKAQATFGPTLAKELMKPKIIRTPCDIWGTAPQSTTQGGGH